MPNSPKVSRPVAIVTICWVGCWFEPVPDRFLEFDNAKKVEASARTRLSSIIHQWAPTVDIETRYDPCATTTIIILLESYSESGAITDIACISKRIRRLRQNDVALK